MYAIDWQSKGVFSCTPALPVASTERLAVSAIWKGPTQLVWRKRTKYPYLDDASKELSITKIIAPNFITFLPVFNSICIGFDTKIHSCLKTCTNLV